MDLYSVTMAYNLLRLSVPEICDAYLYDGNCSAGASCGLFHLKKKAKFSDSHCHLDRLWEKFQVDFRDISFPPNFEFLIANFIDPPFSHLDYFLGFDKVFGTIGVHPSNARSYDQYSTVLFQQLTTNPKIVAVGECGLDAKHAKHVSISTQQHVFEQQLILAGQLNKPVVIHCRDMQVKTFNVARTFLGHNHPIHLHCFIGSVADVVMWRSYFTNIKFGFTNRIATIDPLSGPPFFTAYQQDVVKFLDVAEILVETDAPYFPIKDSHWSFSHPGHALYVAHRVTSIKSGSPYKILPQLHQNVKDLYRI